MGGVAMTTAQRARRFMAREESRVRCPEGTRLCCEHEIESLIDATERRVWREFKTAVLAMELAPASRAFWKINVLSTLAALGRATGTRRRGR